MASGIFYGGLGQSLAQQDPAGFYVEQKNKEMAREVQRQGQAQKQITQNIEYAKEIVAQTVKSGRPASAAAKAIQPILAATAQLAQNAGIPGGADRVTQIGQGLLAMPAAPGSTEPPKVVTVTNANGDKVSAMWDAKSQKFVPVALGGQPTPANLGNVTGVSVNNQPTTQMAASSAPVPDQTRLEGAFSSVAQQQEGPPPEGVPVTDSTGTVGYSTNSYVTKAINQGLITWKDLNFASDQLNLGNTSITTGLGRSSKPNNPNNILRQAITQNAIHRPRIAGQSPAEVARNKFDLQTTSAALRQQRELLSNVESFSNSELANLKVLVNMAKKVDKTGTPIIEKWVRAGRVATGDPDVAAFNAQMQLVRSGAANIIANPRMQGVLSDTARKELEEALPRAANAAQVEKITNLLAGDFKRRHTAIRNQISDIRDQMAKIGKPNKLEKGALVKKGRELQSQQTQKAAPSGHVVIQNGWRYDAVTHEPLGPAQ